MTKMMRDFAGTKPVLQIVGLERTFFQGDRSLEILRGACAEIYDGEAVALVGPSGSGKSSLLHIAGLLEKPGGGSILLNGSRLHRRFRIRTAPASGAPRSGSSTSFTIFCPSFQPLRM